MVSGLHPTTLVGQRTVIATVISPTAADAETTMLEYVNQTQDFSSLADIARSVEAIADVTLQSAMF